MKYTVVYTKRAAKDIKKLDKQTQALILGWIEKNLIGCDNPRLHGKALSANLSGKWRYRVGNYRIIASIDDNTVTIMVLNIGHRSDIYGN